ncbi:MAG: heavy-metal-associated domain-containing protein [bacterium]
MGAVRATIREERIEVRGMICEDCERRIREALLSLRGVISVEVNRSRCEAMVRYDTNIVDLATLYRTIIWVMARARESVSGRE